MQNKISQKQRLQDEARQSLLNYSPDWQNGDKLLIVLKSISPSGLSRRMRVYSQTGNDLTGLVADLCDLSLNNKGLLIKGAGMDMAFWLANHITYKLWPPRFDEEKKRYIDDQKPKWLTGNGNNCLPWQVL